MVPMTRSQMAFARGAGTGVVMILMPSAANTASKDPVNLVSRSRMRNLAVLTCSVRPMQMLRACRVTYSVTGLAVTAAIRARRVSWWMNNST